MFKERTTKKNKKNKQAKHLRKLLRLDFWFFSFFFTIYEPDQTSFDYVRVMAEDVWSADQTDVLVVMVALWNSEKQ